MTTKEKQLSRHLPRYLVRLALEYIREFEAKAVRETLECSVHTLGRSVQHAHSEVQQVLDTASGPLVVLTCAQVNCCAAWLLRPHTGEASFVSLCAVKKHSSAPEDLVTCAERARWHGPSMVAGCWQQDVLVAHQKAVGAYAVHVTQEHVPWLLVKHRCFPSTLYVCPRADGNPLLVFHEPPRVFTVYYQAGDQATEQAAEQAAGQVRGSQVEVQPWVFNNQHKCKRVEVLSGGRLLLMGPGMQELSLVDLAARHSRILASPWLENKRRAEPRWVDFAHDDCRQRLYLLETGFNTLYCWELGRLGPSGELVRFSSPPRVLEMPCSPRCLHLGLVEQRLVVREDPPHTDHVALRLWGCLRSGQVLLSVAGTPNLCVLDVDSTQVTEWPLTFAPSAVHVLPGNDVLLHAHTNAFVLLR